MKRMVDEDLIKGLAENFHFDEDGVSIDGTIIADGVRADGFLAPKSTSVSFGDGTFEKSITIAAQTLTDTSENEMGTVTFPFVYTRISNGKLSVICCATFDITASGTAKAISFSGQTMTSQALREKLIPIDSSQTYGVLDKQLISAIPGTGYQAATTPTNGYQYIRTATDAYGYLTLAGYLSGVNFPSVGKYFIRYEANFII